MYINGKLIKFIHKKGKYHSYFVAYVKDKPMISAFGKTKSKAYKELSKLKEFI